MDQLSTKVVVPEEVTVKDLFSDIWRARILISCVVIVFAGLGVAIGLLMDKQYQASVTISPADDEGNGPLGSLASRYGGLASLAGIALPGGSKKNEAVAVLQSDLLTQRYIQSANLLPVLYPNLWDSKSKQWKRTDPEKQPTLWKANRFFKSSIRKVTDDRKSGLIVLTIKWTDPLLAAKWANDLVDLGNRYLRDKAIEEAQRNIAYLNDQAEKTNVVELRRAIYSLLQDEVNKEMLARGRKEYALKVIDPAFAPEKPSSVGPLLLGATGFAIGILAALFAALVRRILLA